jgi:hypothetical protein
MCMRVCGLATRKRTRVCKVFRQVCGQHRARFSTKDLDGWLVRLEQSWGLR